MSMTNARNTAEHMTAEPMLTPGETRTAKTPDGMDVSVYSVAGGSFTHVRVARHDGSTHYAHNYQFETDALRQFAELKGNQT